MSDYYQGKTAVTVSASGVGSIAFGLDGQAPPWSLVMLM